MRSYDTDTTETQWARIAFCFTQPEGGPGRKRTIDTRRVVDALFYRMRTGCQWRFMPSDFPPYRSVHYYFMKWTRDGTIDWAHRLLRDQERATDGRDPEPTGAVLDSQTAQGTCVSHETGYDGAKKKEGTEATSVSGYDGHPAGRGDACGLDLGTRRGAAGARTRAAAVPVVASGLGG